MEKSNILNKRQKKFIQFLNKDYNLKDAAIKAGYSSNTNPNNILKSLSMQKIFSKENLDIKKSSYENLPQQIIQTLSHIAFSNMFNYVNIKDDKIEVRVDVLNNRQYGEVISSIKNTSNGIEIKLADKERALDMLCKCLGMYNSNSHNISTSIIIDDIK